MGQIVSSVKKCAGLKKSSPAETVRNDHITILVIGDRDVGKTTLIDNFIEEHTDISSREETTPLNPAPKNQDKIRIKNTNQLFVDGHASYSVGISIVEINGSLDVMEKQLRDSYYKTSDIVFILYNIAKVDSLYHVENVWYKEIKDTALRENKASDMQVCVVGVNPEARDQLVETNIYEPDGNDEENMELFRRNTNRKSIGRGQGERVSVKLKHKHSKRDTRHFEVQKDRGKVIEFFNTVVKDYVLSRLNN